MKNDDYIWATSVPKLLDLVDRLNISMSMLRVINSKSKAYTDKLFFQGEFLPAFHDDSQRICTANYV